MSILYKCFVATKGLQHGIVYVLLSLPTTPPHTHTTHITYLHHHLTPVVRGQVNPDHQGEPARDMPCQQCGSEARRRSSVGGSFCSPNTPATSIYTG